MKKIIREALLPKATSDAPFPGMIVSEGRYSIDIFPYQILFMFTICQSNPESECISFNSLFEYQESGITTH
jgi:hypothetical protein